jgi:putative hydrolase of the HAD superfamily
VISNGWPSLDRQLRQLGVRDFFDVLVVSAHVGSRKPDEGIFRHALQAMNLPADAILLVDDALENVVVAERLGMRGVVLTREGSLVVDDYTHIASLSDLEVSP